MDKKFIKIIILLIIILMIWVFSTFNSKKENKNPLNTKFIGKKSLEYKQPPKLDRKYITDPSAIYEIDSASRFLDKGLGVSKTSEEFDLPFPTEASIDSPLIVGTDKMENDQVQWIFSLKEHSTNRLVSQGFYITQMDDGDKYTKIKTKWNINKKIEKNKNYYITLSLKSAWGAQEYKNSTSPETHTLNSTEWHGKGDSEKLFIDNKTIVEYGKFKDLLFNESTNPNLKNKNIILKDLTFSWYFGGAKKETLGGKLKEFFTLGLAKDRYVIPQFILNNKEKWTANYSLEGNVTYLSQLEIEEALRNIFTIHISSTQEKNLKNSGSFWLDKNNPPKLSIGLNNNIFKAYEEKKWGKELDTRIKANSSYSESTKKAISKAIEEGRINQFNWNKVQNDINNNSFNESELAVPFWAIFLSQKKAPKINNQNIIDWLMAKKQMGYYSKISERKENYELLSLYLNNASNINLKLFKEYGDRENSFIIPINNSNLLETKIPLENESQKTFNPSIIIKGYDFEYKGLNCQKNITNIKPKVYEDLGKYGINYNSIKYKYSALYQPNAINIDSGVWFYPIRDSARKYDWELKQINRNQEVINLENNNFVNYLLKIAKNKLSLPISNINDFDKNFPKDLKNYFFTKDGKKFKIKSFQRINNKYLAIGNIEKNKRNEDFVLLLNGQISEKVDSINFNNVLTKVRKYINQKTIHVDGITTDTTAKVPSGIVSNHHEYFNSQRLTKAEYDLLPVSLKNKFVVYKYAISGKTNQYYRGDWNPNIQGVTFSKSSDSKDGVANSFNNINEHGGATKHLGTYNYEDSVFSVDAYWARNTILMVEDDLAKGDDGSAISMRDYFGEQKTYYVVSKYLEKQITLSSTPFQINISRLKGTKSIWDFAKKINFSFKYYGGFIKAKKKYTTKKIMENIFKLFLGNSNGWGSIHGGTKKGSLWTFPGSASNSNIFNRYLTYNKNKKFAGERAKVFWKTTNGSNENRKSFIVQISAEGKDDSGEDGAYTVLDNIHISIIDSIYKFNGNGFISANQVNNLPYGLTVTPYTYAENQRLTKAEYDSLLPVLKRKFTLYSNRWKGQHITKSDISMPVNMLYSEKKWNIKIDRSTYNLLDSLKDYVVYSNELIWQTKPKTKIIKRDNQTLKRGYSSFIYKIKNKKKNIEKRSFYQPKIPKDKKNPYDLTTWFLSSDKSITLSDYLSGNASPEFQKFNLDNVTYVVNKNLIMIINPYQRQSTFKNVKYYDHEAAWKIHKIINFKDGKEEILADFENHKLSNTFNKAFSMTRTGHPTTQGQLTNGNNNISAKMINFKRGKTKYKILVDTIKPAPTYQNLNERNEQLYYKENDKFYDFYTSTKSIALNWIESGIKSAFISWVDSNGTWYKKAINILEIKNGENFKQQIDLIVDYQGLYKIEYIDIAGNYKKDFLWIQKKKNSSKNFIAYAEYPKNELIADTIFANNRTIWFDSNDKKTLLIKNVLNSEALVKIFNKKTGKMEVIKNPPWITYQKQKGKSIGSTINSGQKTFSLAGDELTPLINDDPSITKTKTKGGFKEAHIKVPYDSYIELKLKTNIFYQDENSNFKPFYSYLNILNSNKYDFNKYKVFKNTPFEVTEAIGTGQKEGKNIFSPNESENHKVTTALKDGWIKVPTKFDTGIIKGFTKKIKVNYSKLYYNWYNEIKYLDGEEIFLKKEGKYKIEVIDKNNHKTIYKFLVFNYPRNFSKYVINSSETEKVKDENGKTLIKKVIRTKEFYNYPAIASIQDKSIYHLKGEFLNFNKKLPIWTEGLNLKIKSYFYDFRVKKTAKNLKVLKTWLKRDLKNGWINIDPINNPITIKDKSGKNIQLFEFVLYGKGETKSRLNNFKHQAIRYQIDDRKRFIGTPQGIPSSIKITQIKDSATKLSDQKLKQTAYWEGKYIDVYEESNQLPELLINHDNNDSTPKVHLYEDYDHYQNYLAEWLANGGTKEDFFKSKSNPLGGEGGKENIIKSINKEKMKRGKKNSKEDLPNYKVPDKPKVKDNDEQTKKLAQKNTSNIAGKKIGIIFGGLFGGLGLAGISSFVIYKRYKRGFGKIKIPKKG